MNYNSTITTNNILFDIISVDEIKYSVGKPGVLLRYVNGERNIKDWLLHYKKYHVKVKNKEEAHNRIFVLTPNEAKYEIGLEL